MLNMWMRQTLHHVFNRQTNRGDTLKLVHTWSTVIESRWKASWNRLHIPHSWLQRWRFRSSSATNSLAFVALSTFWALWTLTQQWSWAKNSKDPDGHFTVSSENMLCGGWCCGLCFQNSLHCLVICLVASCRMSRSQANQTTRDKWILLCSTSCQLQLQMVSCCTQQTTLYPLFKQTLSMQCSFGGGFFCFLHSELFCCRWKCHCQPGPLAAGVWGECFSVNWGGGGGGCTSRLTG